MPFTYHLPLPVRLLHSTLLMSAALIILHFLARRAASPWNEFTMKEEHARVQLWPIPVHNNDLIIIVGNNGYGT